MGRRRSDKGVEDRKVKDKSILRRWDSEPLLVRPVEVDGILCLISESYGAPGLIYNLCRTSVSPPSLVSGHFHSFLRVPDI